MPIQTLQEETSYSKTHSIFSHFLICNILRFYVNILGSTHPVPHTATIILVFAYISLVYE